MNWEAWLTLGVLVSVLGTLATTRRAPDVVVLAGLALLLVTGVLNPGEALAGFANEGVIAIGALFAVAAGLRETGVTSWAGRRLLGRPRSLLAAQLRIMLPTGVMSAFMNNTPLVAVLLPVVNDWATERRFSVSKLLIPLSFASILGGACTLIGTSTNIVANGWLIGEGRGGLGMFEIAKVGLPCALVGIGFVLLAGRWLLPDRRPPFSAQDDPRSYTVEMTVEPDGPLVGETVEEAGLRHLPGMYLMEIEREGEVIPAVAPTEKLHTDDRLVFVGVVESIVDLQKIRGLAPATEQVFKLDAPRSRRTLVEAVVSDSCPLVGLTIRAGRFRTRYDAVVIAVARSGRRINRKIGDIVLRPGDTLLLEALPSFADQQRNSRDFFLVSTISGSTPPRHERAPVAALVLLVLVAAVATGWLSMVKASLLAAALMIGTRCCTASAARRSVNWQVLLVIAASIGIGKAMEVSGLALMVAEGLVPLVHGEKIVVLIIVYGLTAVLAGLVTAQSGAVLMLPIAYQVSETVGADFMPFAIAVMVAAATTVATPIGYATNLMVYGPGGYRYSDYLRIGAPLSILVGAIALVMIPRVWEF